MPVKVIDASALATVLFGEPEAENIVTRIQGFTLACPSLLPFEIASVCLKKIRRHPARRSSLLAAYRLLESMEIVQTEVDFNELILLAERRKLTVYDTAYLWLAQQLRTEIVTLDGKLAAAAAVGPS